MSQNTKSKTRKWKSSFAYPTGESQDSPYRYWVPDLHTKNPGFGIKGGIAGAISEPAEFAGRYIYENYYGDLRKQQFERYARIEYQKFRRGLIDKYKNWSAYNYGRDAFQKTIQKNATYEGSSSKFQTSKKRTYFVRRPKRKSPVQSLYRKRSRFRSYNRYSPSRKQGVQCQCKCKFHARKWKRYR